MTVLLLNASHLGLIGDALCAVPWISAAAQDYRGAVVLSGFCSGVREMLGDEWLNGNATEQDAADATYLDLDLQRVFNHCNRIDTSLHMAQGWFAVAGEPVPLLPIELPLCYYVPRSFSPRTVVFSPFSHSDYMGNKLWPLHRWAELGHTLLESGRASEIIVVGSLSGDGGWDEVNPHDYFTNVVDRPLPEVLGTMRCAALVISIDNGISHLAHFGGVSQHLLLAPACLPASFVANPRGRMIRGVPIDITVQKVLEAAEEMLR